MDTQYNRERPKTTMEALRWSTVESLDPLIRKRCLNPLDKRSELERRKPWLRDEEKKRDREVGGWCRGEEGGESWGEREDARARVGVDLMALRGVGSYWDLSPYLRVGTYTHLQGLIKYILKRERGGGEGAARATGGQVFFEGWGVVEVGPLECRVRSDHGVKSREMLDVMTTLPRVMICGIVILIDVRCVPEGPVVSCCCRDEFGGSILRNAVTAIAL